MLIFHVLNTIANLVYRKTTSFTSGEYNIASFISAANEKNFGGIKFSIHSWENNRTWISFIDPTKEYTFSLSQNLCKTLGYTRCIFPGSGNYPSEMSQIDVGRPPHNELCTLFFHKWTTKKIVTTVNSTLEKSIECLSNQTDGAVKVLLSCDGTKFAIHKSNSSLYLQFTEDFNLQFGLDPVLIGSTLTILDKNSTSAHPFTLKDEWNKCSKNLTIVSLTSSSKTFMKGDAISLLGLIQSINRRFIKSPFFMNITISSSKNQPTSIITFLDQFDKYIITFSEELSQVLGINQTQFHASGEYTGSTSADDEIFNGLDPDQEFIITLTQKAIQRIHIPPPQYMSYPSTVKTINNALQSFGSHKIALTISQDFENLEINIFTNLSVTFSPCLNKLFHMKPFDSFTSSSTSIQLPPILLPKDINTRPQIIPSTSQNAEEEEESGTAMDTSPDDAVDDNTSMQVEDDARKVPTSQDQRKCYTIINEILPTKRWLNTLSKKQFIEIVHRCGKKAKKSNLDKMDGYMTLIVDIGTYKTDFIIQPALVFSSDLSKVVPTRRVLPDEALEWYIVIGTADTENVNQEITEPFVEHIYSSVAGYSNAIPYENYHPTAILLLYFKFKDRRKMKRFALSKRTLGVDTEFVPMQLTPDLLALIKEHAIDLFVYGQGCGPTHGKIIQKMYEGYPEDCVDNIFATRTVIPFHEQDILQTYSRCTDSIHPFQISSFADTDETPGETNKCSPDSEIIYEFDLIGKSLQSTAQKAILNVWVSLRQGKTNPSILEGTPREVAARLAGVTEAQLTRANKRWRGNTISTPQRNGKRPCPVQTKIDEFDRNWIRSEIVKSYKNGAAITAADLYKKFMHYKKEYYDDEMLRHRSNPDNHSRPDIFHCSKNTFHRVLHLMGFTNGVIDKRAGISQREDIVIWRGKYLRELRRNEAAEKPFKIVYIDETWVDGNMHVARGWFPKTCKSIKEMAPFTYGTTSMATGPRLIVLSALTEDGQMKNGS
ncbi:uncharacterized protein LOC110856211 isoform X1 [Folsomia candida]|uniref:uncharacterized protein LOC110856211 isoform X1 n=1 Tax=Folsomia candida TaxID=158441 RepID=UPI001604BB95|nr:uncharacterized protein LOC110856211 isoform X1 [Folsomia candida]